MAKCASQAGSVSKPTLRIKGASVAAVALMALGCTQNPLSNDLARTPYGRYQALRDGEPPMEKPDTFGNMKPALRERLQPMQGP